MQRTVQSKVKGFRTTDGAGVQLVRVLGHNTVEASDPILMLDSFDSHDPQEYIAGFPMHPHRGIETISYIYAGKMTHRDSLGNEDTIGDGEVQWMTAGSGILHEEKLPASERMLGVQLWLNLAAKDKMVPPAYYSIKNEEIQEISIPHGKLRLLAGTFEENAGFAGKYQPLDYYDIHLQENASFQMKTDEKKTVLLFTLVGGIFIGEEWIEEKTAVCLTAGTELAFRTGDEAAQVLYISSERLDEPISWGGPIVMNTQTELQEAFADLQRGTFLREKVEY